MKDIIFSDPANLSSVAEEHPTSDQLAEPEFYKGNARVLKTTDFLSKTQAGTLANAVNVLLSVGIDIKSFKVLGSDKVFKIKNPYE